MKKRFEILNNIDQHSYDYDTECKLVLCAIVFHKYIRQHQLQHGNDDDYKEQEYNEDQEQVNAVAEDNEVIKNWRDEMAQRMWD